MMGDEPDDYPLPAAFVVDESERRITKLSKRYVTLTKVELAKFVTEFGEDSEDTLCFIDSLLEERAKVAEHAPKKTAVQDPLDKIFQENHAIPKKKLSLGYKRSDLAPHLCGFVQPGFRVCGFRVLREVVTAQKPKKESQECRSEKESRELGPFWSRYLLGSGYGYDQASKKRGLLAHVIGKE